MIPVLYYREILHGLYFLVVDNTGVFFLNYFIGNSIFNLVFTSFCILILLNGSNLCDGVNCNVMGYYLILCTAIMLSDLSPPSAFLQIEIIVNIFFIFYIFNLFKKYFLGDSGVYVISIFMAVYIIQFINLNTTASPLIALNLLWYPAFENLFSILRLSFILNYSLLISLNTLIIFRVSLSQIRF